MVHFVLQKEKQKRNPSPHSLCFLSSLWWRGGELPRGPERLPRGRHPSPWASVLLGVPGPIDSGTGSSHLTQDRTPLHTNPALKWTHFLAPEACQPWVRFHVDRRYPWLILIQACPLLAVSKLDWVPERAQRDLAHHSAFTPWPPLVEASGKYADE